MNVVVGENLRKLMDWQELTQRQLAAKSGVSQRHISNVLRGVTGTSIESLDRVARVFGLRGWQLAIPGIADDPSSATWWADVFKAWSTAPDDGKQLVQMVAKREAGRRTS